MYISNRIARSQKKRPGTTSKAETNASPMKLMQAPQRVPTYFFYDYREHVNRNTWRRDLFVTSIEEKDVP